MELHQLRYFVAVVDAGGFGRAGAACHVSQPSLSQQIRKLEAELGEPLFDRLGRTVALTAAGRALLPRARRVLAEVDAVRRGVADEAGGETGSLAVAAIPTISPFLLPGAIQRFVQTHPRAELLVREDLTEILLDRLARAELDLVVCSLPLEADWVAYEQLAAEPLLLAVPDRHALARRRRVSPAALEREPAVVLHEMHCLGQQVRAFCRQERLTPRIVCRAGQLGTVLSLVGLGLGLSIVPRMCAATDRRRGCCFRQLAGPAPGRAIVAAWHARRRRPRLAETFVAMLRAECRRLARLPVR
ncbi:MAG: LysR family transcriptional regulator [Candidatus Methylomirabilales bacterium]